MTTAGTYYYPPSAGTGNLLLANPPFIMGKPAADHLNDYLTYALYMDINQPAPTDGLPELTEDDFLKLSVDVGGGEGKWGACLYDHALQIARAAYRMGADVELGTVVKWMESFVPCCDYTDDLRAARRPKPPSLKQQALTILDDCSARLDAAHENTLRRALEALPE